MLYGRRFSAEPPEDACHDGTRQRGKEKKISAKRHAEKTCADCADQKQGAGMVGKHKDMLGFFRREFFFFIKLGSDLRADGITGKTAKEKGQGGNTVQTE